MVRISVPVSPAAAAALDDEDSLRDVGRLISALVLREDPSRLAPSGDFLKTLLRIRAGAAASGLTDDDVDAELAARKRERASGHR